MNSVFKQIAPRALSFVLAFSLIGLAACSKGTDAGDTNVESSDYKDRNPTEHNRSKGTLGDDIDTHQDTIDALMDTAKVRNDPYERSAKQPHAL